MVTHKILRADGSEIQNIKSVVFSETVNADKDLRPGAAVSANIEVEVYGAKTDTPENGEELSYFNDAGGMMRFIGKFYAEPAVTTRFTYGFTAYDAMSKLDVLFSPRLKAMQSRFPMTLKTLVNEACAVAGVTHTAITSALANVNIQAFYADNITCRQIVAWAAEMQGCYAKCSPNGIVVFEWYSQVTRRDVLFPSDETFPDDALYPSVGTESGEYSIGPGVGENVIAYKQDGLKYESYDINPVSCVEVRPIDTDGVAYIYPSASSNPLVISGNLLLTSANSATMTLVAKTIYEKMQEIPVWRPSEIGLFPWECPYRAGQIVQVTSSQNDTFRTLIMNYRLDESVAALSSTGNEVYDEYQQNVSKAMTNLSASIVELNRLKVGWAEIQQAIIQYLTLYGFMEVYEDSSLQNSGGQIGFATGSNYFGDGIAIQKIGPGGEASGTVYAYNGGAIIVGEKGTFIGSGKGIQLDGGVDVNQTNFSQYIRMNAADLYEDAGDIECAAGGFSRSGYREPNLIMSIGTNGARSLRPVNTFNGYSDFEHIEAPEIGDLDDLDTTDKNSLVAAINELASRIETLETATYPNG